MDYNRFSERREPPIEIVVTVAVMRGGSDSFQMEKYPMKTSKMLDVTQSPSEPFSLEMLLGHIIDHIRKKVQVK